jgi:hypothetical protein
VLHGWGHVATEFGRPRVLLQQGDTPVAIILGPFKAAAVGKEQGESFLHRIEYGADLPFDCPYVNPNQSKSSNSISKPPSSFQFQPFNSLFVSLTQVVNV